MPTAADLKCNGGNDCCEHQLVEKTLALAIDHDDDTNRILVKQRQQDSQANNGAERVARIKRQCQSCQKERAVIVRPKNGQRLCRSCFFEAFEREIHETVTRSQLFKRGDKVGIGASGGKDSTVLIHIMDLLNKRYDYGLELHLISIDEGIKGYRDDSLETVKRNHEFYKLPLSILSYKELFGWSMDEIVSLIGKKNNCTFCGVFRRQALDKCAERLGIQHIVTGHNADDAAETVLMNLFRGDIARLPRSTLITTCSEGSYTYRSKPLIYAYEKEIVMYAHFHKLDYFSTECTYSPEAFRNFARTLVKEAERRRPHAIIDTIVSGDAFRHIQNTEAAETGPRACQKCGYMTSRDVCKACLLLQTLERNRSKTLLENGT